MCEKRSVRYEAQHFSVIELAKGVYAAVEKDGKTGSNAGIIDLGESSMLFDTFLNIDAAKELVEVSRQLGCSPIRYVVNSHSHADHIVGNALFKDAAVIIGSTAARAETEKFRKAFEAEREQYAGELVKINEELQHEKDEVKIADLQNGFKFLTNLLKPGAVIYPQNLEFDGEMVIHSSTRSVRLTAFEKAHSGGDVIAYLPAEEICFAGDLVLGSTHPMLGSGDPEGFVRVLEELLKLDIKCCVTGHGHLAGRAEIELMIRYIRELLKLVKENPVGGKELKPEDLPADFRGWDSLCFPWNINFLRKNEKRS